MATPLLTFFPIPEERRTLVHFHNRIRKGCTTLDLGHDMNITPRASMRTTQVVRSLASSLCAWPPYIYL